MWEKQNEHEKADKLIAEGYSRLTATVLAKAGISEREDAEEFLHSVSLHDPALIRNIGPATDLI